MDNKNNLKKWMPILLWLALLALMIYCLPILSDLQGITEPDRQSQVARILTALSQPNFQDREVVQDVIASMWQTFQIAFLATALSALLAVPLTLWSARPGSILGRAFNILLQPILSILRSVHPLFVIILFLVAVGIGPTAGVFALTLYSTAVLTGLFSDYASQHTSLKWSTLLTTHFPGLAFKHLPVNLLIATILGTSGGGGIGLFLIQNINLLEYQNVSLALLACILLIASLDLLTRAVWRKIQKDTGLLLDNRPT